MSIRPATEADLPAIARVHVDTWRSAYGGILAADFLAKQTYADFEKRRRERFATPGTQLFAAETGGEIAGFAICGPNRELHAVYDAELYAIYVRREAARRGLGRGLVAACAAWLVAEQRRAMILWVLRDNPAGRRFYESLGGVPAGERNAIFGDREYAEVAYGWPDLAALAAKLNP